MGLYGLKEVFEALYKEKEGSEKIPVEKALSMLESYGNYIPNSKEAKKEYASVILREYKKFLKEKKRL